MKNNTKKTALLLSTALLIPVTTHAASITNGDFQTGDFSGWVQDIDGAGAPITSLNDFTIVQPAAGNHAARIEADHWSTPGDTTSTAQDEAFFAATLFQNLDLTASAGQVLTLNVN